MQNVRSTLGFLVLACPDAPSSFNWIASIGQAAAHFPQPAQSASLQAAMKRDVTRMLG